MFITNWIYSHPTISGLTATARAELLLSTWATLHATFMRFSCSASPVARERGTLGSPSKAINSVSADPPIYSDTSSLLISLIKLPDWRQGRKCVQSSRPVVNSHAYARKTLWWCHMSWLNCIERAVSRTVYHAHSAHNVALHLRKICKSQLRVCLCLALMERVRCH